MSGQFYTSPQRPRLFPEYSEWWSLWSARCYDRPSVPNVPLKRRGVVLEVYVRQLYLESRCNSAVSGRAQPDWKTRTLSEEEGRFRCAVTDQLDVPLLYLGCADVRGQDVHLIRSERSYDSGGVVNADGQLFQVVHLGDPLSLRDLKQEVHEDRTPGGVAGCEAAADPGADWESWLVVPGVGPGVYAERAEDGHYIARPGMNLTRILTTAAVITLMLITGRPPVEESI